MREIISVLVVSILLSISGINTLAQGGSHQATNASPEVLVAALYKAH
ncbi:MAG: hypothetical protein QOH96_2706, partial [Blastocatellia bacterium]|nr:hypothetical protein [Blastocatellia bacterium]